MTITSFLPYDDRIHRKVYFDMNGEYFTYVLDIVIKTGYENENIGKTLDEHARALVDANFGRTLSILKPSEGVLYILEVDGEAAGMGALRKLDDGIGEIKRMYIRSEHRGKGYGKEMLEKLTDKARALGYSTLRLDTAKYLETAIQIYKSAGFKEVSKYQGTMSEGPGYIYMEKKIVKYFAQLLNQF